MEFIWTFLEGLASFVSPCTLPLMPVFAAYFAAGDGSDGRPGSGGCLRATAFVAGFTAVFMTLGLFAATVGGFFAAHRTAVSVVSGLVVIVFGLAFLDVIRLPGFKGASAGMRRRGVAGAFVFGLLYSVNLTPCVGAFLAAALATAAESGHALKGAALLGAYSAGLGVPFVVAGAALAKVNGLFRRIKSAYGVLVPLCGVALILFGVWMVAKPFARAAAAKREPAAAAAVPERVAAGEPLEIASEAMFEAEVLASAKPVVVDFWAPWCGPCRAMGPVLSEISAERPDLKVCKVNVDEFGELAARYGVTSIPCILCIRGGKAAARSVGRVGKTELLSALGL